MSARHEAAVASAAQALADVQLEAVPSFSGSLGTGRMARARFDLNAEIPVAGGRALLYLPSLVLRRSIEVSRDHEARPIVGYARLRRIEDDLHVEFWPSMGTQAGREIDAALRRGSWRLALTLRGVPQAGAASVVWLREVRVRALSFVLAAGADERVHR